MQTYYLIAQLSDLEKGKESLLVMQKPSKKEDLREVERETENQRHGRLTKRKRKQTLKKVGK